MFADEPSLVAGQMLLTLVPDPLRWSVGDPHPDRGETSLELSFRAGAPTDGAPFGVGQHIFSRSWHTCCGIRLAQCDRKTGTGGRASILMVAPPRINSRIRECPYAPMTRRSAFRYVT